MMAFTLRRPFTITSALRSIPKSSPTTTIRQFHQTPLRSNFFTQQSRTTPSSALSKTKPVLQNAFRNPRFASNTPLNPIANTGNKTQQLLTGAGIFLGGALALNLIFNRETREDGGMPPYERTYLNDTFMHTGLGLGIIAVAARALHTNGWSVRLMAANPWLVVGVGLVGSIGTMLGCRATPPEK